MDVTSDFNILGGLPKGTARRALDAEIANEGGKVISGEVVILSNGDQVAWTPPPEKLSIPDLSTVKSLRHYFGQRGYQPYPAWLYHPKLAPLLVKDAKEAAGRGIVYRETTTDERNRYGLKHVWDWEVDCEWRPNPWQEAKFDPKHPGSGKTVVYAAADPSIAQHALIAQMIPQVAAAVAQVLQANGPSAPATVDPAVWKEFVAFQAWQKTQEIVTAAAAVVEAPQNLPAGDELALDDASTNTLTPEQDRLLWETEAERLGIKVDGRWSIERLKSEVQKKSIPGAA